ncbi:MAG: YARHG domain-containing protein [Caulobacterales bacterium]
MFGRRLRAVLIGVLAAIGLATPVLADCYDLLGCDNKDLFSRNYAYLASIRDGPTCDFLWVMRNRIYQQHGYCFATARGISEMGNAGCYIRNQSAVPLSNIERANIATIQRAERAKACTP